MVSVAELGNSATSVDDLIDKVFPNFQETVVDSDWLSERVPEPSTNHELHSMHRYKIIEKRYRGENCCWAIQNESHVIPRIRFQPSDSILPFTFQQQHFPLRPCLGLTINTSQGQMLQLVGLDLRTPVFSHGMLYVALSRTGRKDDIHILTEGEVKSNVMSSTQRHWI